MFTVKGYSAEQRVLCLPEKQKTAVDKGKVFWALLLELSNSFICLNGEPFIAKLNTYGFTLLALKLVHEYLSDECRKYG